MVVTMLLVNQNVFQVIGLISGLRTVLVNAQLSHYDTNNLSLIFFLFTFGVRVWIQTTLSSELVKQMKKIMQTSRLYNNIKALDTAGKL